MALTYTPIATISSSSLVTFSSIPQTYTDLVIRMSFRANATSTLLEIRYNGSLVSQMLELENVTATNQSAGYLNNAMPISSSTANVYASSTLYIKNYTGSYKGGFYMGGWPTATVHAGLPTITAAITSLTFNPNSGGFETPSTFSLYGVLRA